jgi:hypothetical protein
MNNKTFTDDDPMELVGMVIPGEPGQLELMAEALVDEYARMGWDEKRLMSLFVNPFFLATHRIYHLKGADYVAALIHEVCGRWQLDSNQ